MLRLGLSRLAACGCSQLKASPGQLSPLRWFSEPGTAPLLTKERAKSLVLKLTEDERNNLSSSLNEYESQLKKEEYKGQLAAFRWRSKFGRPSSVPNLGDVDPTGSYCPVPEDWLFKKYVALVNAVPFVGFGFLDNSIMIICGDYIEASMGSVVVLSTMAAAALGNTFSDVIGIGSAYYVELAASKIGIKPPPLSPVQLDLGASRISSNLGRVLGVTIGCILGMTPLLFIKKEESEPTEEAAVATAP